MTGNPPRPPLIEHLDVLGRLWGLPGFAASVDLSFSARMTHNFGRCYPLEARVVVAERLLSGPPEALYEVVTHEYAHVAVFRLYGERRRPHGPEWRALMRAAGYTPRAQVPGLPSDPPRRRKPKRYLHECTRCGASRRAARPVPEWRCTACCSAGYDGRVHIRDH